ncbi:sugar transporter SWEET1-like [Clavelina lepadiformis]|uniref:sugar transporter SWEET1-like n=1 Tax=Clavelina lepadiformis TaxID=159417 RepID=UPI0040430E00
MDWSGAVSFAATVTTILMYLTGWQVISKVIRRKSTQGLLVHPFIACFVSCTLWTKYGMLTDDNTMFYVNVIGSVFEGFYVALFYFYTKSKNTVAPPVTVLLIFLFAVLAYTKYVTIEGEKAIYHQGMICSSFNIVNYAAPLSAAASVIRKKSTENISFLLSLVYFLMALEWFIYGYMRIDLFVEVPNLIGIFFGAFQLSLFFFFPSKGKSKSIDYHKTVVEGRM